MPHEDSAINEALIRFVRSYQEAQTAKKRLLRASFIFDIIESDLRLFVLGKVNPNEADDVAQEIFMAIIGKLDRFRGKTAEEFWGLCYQIARNKMADHFKKGKNYRMKMDELAKLLELSAELERFSPQDWTDVRYAMDLLAKSKPECHDLLWNRFVIGLDYMELAKLLNLKYDAIRMKVGRCLELARGLL